MAPPAPMSSTVSKSRRRSTAWSERLGTRASPLRSRRPGTSRPRSRSVAGMLPSYRLTRCNVLTFVVKSDKRAVDAVAGRWRDARRLCADRARRRGQREVGPGGGADELGPVISDEVESVGESFLDQSRRRPQSSQHRAEGFRRAHDGHRTTSTSWHRVVGVRLSTRAYGRFATRTPPAQLGSGRRPCPAGSTGAS